MLDVLLVTVLTMAPATMAVAGVSLGVALGIPLGTVLGTSLPIAGGGLLIVAAASLVLGIKLARRKRGR